MKSKPILLLITCAVALTAMGISLTDVAPNEEQQQWALMRTVSSNDTPLTAATKTWTYVEESFYPFQRDWDEVYIAFLCYGDGTGAGDPNGGSFAFNVLAVRPYSSAQKVCSGTATVGELQASHHPTTQQALTITNEDYKWAEGEFTVLASDQVWRKPIGLSGTTDDMGNLSFETMNEYGIYVEITSLSGVSAVYVFITGNALL